MRTTLDIDDDVLLSVRVIARERGCSLGQVLSELAPQALIEHPSTSTRNGVPLFPVQPGAAPVTPELVNQLRDGPWQRG